MRGTKAKRLRREAPPKLDLGYRPPEYTHPIDPGPGRAEKRGQYRNFLQAIRRSARKRDKWAAHKGQPTPAEPIRAAIKRLVERGVPFDLLDDGRRFWPVQPSRNRWKKWKGAMIPRRTEGQ